LRQHSGHFDFDPVFWVDQATFNHRCSWRVIAEHRFQRRPACGKFVSVGQHIRDTDDVLKTTSRLGQSLTNRRKRVFALRDNIITLPDCSCNMDKSTCNDSPAIANLGFEFATR